MVTVFVIIHVLVSFIMIGVVLLQAGKGAEIGAAFGGSSQTIFGSRGPGTFLSKITVGAAVVFMLTSLTLSTLSGSRSIVSDMEIEAPLEAEERPLGQIPLTGQVPPLMPAETGDAAATPAVDDPAAEGAPVESTQPATP